ncbi:hypothetical protein ABEW05_001082 [Botrytis cinerea]
MPGTAVAQNVSRRSAPQGPGLFGGTSASRKRFAAGLSSAELEVHRIGLRAELDAVRGEQVDREALGNQREEEEEEEEKDVVVSPAK